MPSTAGRPGKGGNRSHRLPPFLAVSQCSLHTFDTVIRPIALLLRRLGDLRVNRFFVAVDAAVISAVDRLRGVADPAGRLCDRHPSVQPPRDARVAETILASSQHTDRWLCRWRLYPAADKPEAVRPFDDEQRNLCSDRPCFAGNDVRVRRVPDRAGNSGDQPRI